MYNVAAGMELIARLSCLTRLSLDNSNVGDEGACRLASLEHLVSLSLSGTRISDVAVEVCNVAMFVG
jgi:hypothetical protein